MLWAINILMEAISLYAIWPLRQIWAKLFLGGMLAFDLVSWAIPQHDFIYWYCYWGCKGVNVILLSFMLESMIEKKYWQVELWSTTILILIGTLSINTWWYKPGLTDRNMTFMITAISCLTTTLGIAAFISKRTLVTFGAMCWPIAYAIHGLLLNKMRLDWLPYMSLVPLTIWCVSALPKVKRENGYQPSDYKTEKANGGSNLVAIQS